ncbi:MAG TPA: GAF domain-containing protein, partial [Spirochaetota bacterium]|nr:GAF domain-containing protein [Spirochaetota bacterium]
MQTENYEFKELSILFEISKKLDDSMNLKDVLFPVLKIIADNMNMHLGTLTIFNRNTKEIVIEEAYGLSEEQRARGRYRIGEGITGKVVETGEPIIVKKVSDESKFLDKTRAREQLNKKDISFICVPIKIGKEVIGTLSFDRYFVDDLTLERDLKLI